MFHLHNKEKPTCGNVFFKYSMNQQLLGLLFRENCAHSIIGNIHLGNALLISLKSFKLLRYRNSSFIIQDIFYSKLEGII